MLPHECIYCGGPMEHIGRELYQTGPGPDDDAYFHVYECHDCAAVCEVQEGHNTTHWTEGNES